MLDVARPVDVGSAGRSHGQFCGVHEPRWDGTRHGLGFVQYAAVSQLPHPCGGAAARHIAGAAQELPDSVLASHNALATDASRAHPVAAELVLSLALRKTKRPTDGIDRRAEAREAGYQPPKATVLEAGAMGTLAPSAMAVLLRSNSTLRRCLQQALKASGLLRTPDGAIS